jgi:hypothetical protein
MDIKKIKPNDVLGFLDGLVAKIPESISRIIRSIVFILFGIVTIYAIYKAFLFGYSTADQEGLELARDTKSIFLEEIEREYNRKKRTSSGVSYSGVQLEDSEFKPKKKYEPYGRELDSETIVSPEENLLESPLKARVPKVNTSPLMELEDSSIQTQPLYKSNTEVEKPKKLYKLKDNFEPFNENFSEPTNSFESSYSQPYTKPVDKKKIQPTIENQYQPIPESTEKKNKLQIPSKSTSSDKSKLIPIE